MFKFFGLNKKKRDGYIDFERFNQNHDEYFSGKHFYAHGDKWDVLFGAAEYFLVNHLRESVQKSSIVFTQEVNGHKYAGLVCPENSPIQIMSIIEQSSKSNEYVSSYPLLEGINNNLLLKRAHAWDVLAEGEIAAETDCDRLINFFNPYFAKDIHNFYIG